MIPGAEAELRPNKEQVDALRDRCVALLETYGELQPTTLRDAVLDALSRIPLVRRLVVSVLISRDRVFYTWVDSDREAYLVSEGDGSPTDSANIYVFSREHRHSLVLGEYPARDWGLKLPSDPDKLKAYTHDYIQGTRRVDDPNSRNIREGQELLRDVSFMLRVN